MKVPITMGTFLTPPGTFSSRWEHSSHPRERYHHGGNVTRKGGIVCCQSARSQENGNDPTQPGPWNLPGFFGGVPCDLQPQRRVAPNSTSFKVVSREVDDTYPRQRPRKSGYVFNWKIAEEAYNYGCVHFGFWFAMFIFVTH